MPVLDHEMVEENSPGLFCWTISWSRTDQISMLPLITANAMLAHPTLNPEEPSSRDGDLFPS